MSEGQSRIGFAGAAVLAVVTLGLVLVHHRDTVASIVSIWGASETYAHGWVIVPIVLWLVWRQRSFLGQIAARANPFGFLVMLSATLLWIIADIVGVQVAQHFSLFLMVFGVVLGLLGWQAMRQLSFPLVYLVFAVPFGEILIPTLMEITAFFTIATIKLTGIPVFRSGMFFALPSGDFEIAVACSGIRYLIASVALGTLFAYLSFNSASKRSWFILASIIVPILANGARAFLIVMIAHFSDMKMAVGIDHFIYGWLFFGIVMFVLFFLGSRFQEDVEIELAGGAAATPSPLWVQVAAAIVMLGIAIGLPLASMEMRASVQSAEPAVSLPRAGGAWRGPVAPTVDYRPSYRDATSSLAGRYVSAAGDVHVFIAHYPASAGAELINQRNKVFGGEWVREDLGARLTAGRAGHQVIQTPILRGNTELMIWHWYEVNGAAAVGEVGVKLRKLRDTLLGRYRGASLVALATPLEELPEDVEALMSAFLDEHLDRLRACASDADDNRDACDDP